MECLFEWDILFGMVFFGIVGTEGCVPELVFFKGEMVSPCHVKLDFLV